MDNVGSGKFATVKKLKEFSRDSQNNVIKIMSYDLSCQFPCILIFKYRDHIFSSLLPSLKEHGY